MRRFLKLAFAGALALGMVNVVFGATAIVTGVECHVIAVGSDVRNGLSLDAVPTAEANAIVSVDDAEIINTATATSSVWRAKSVGSHTVRHSVGDVSISATYNVVGIIGDLKVTPISPWGMAIDYNVIRLSDRDDDFVLHVEATVDGSTHVARSLSGETNCVSGAHRIYWNMAADGITANAADAEVSLSYVRPTSDFNRRSLYCVIDLSGGASAESYPVEYLTSEPLAGFNTTEYKTTKLVMKRVEAGTFVMGSDQTNEAHRVTLTKPFYMGLYEVTQKQWELVMGSNPSGFMGAAYPVERVSYDDIRGSSDGANWPSTNLVDTSSFLGKLRKRTGVDFDLQTEAQWEYTCRAGTTTTYSYGDSVNGDYMWYYSNSSRSTHEVGTKKANPWGFYDMHGNVWEWCLDRYGALMYSIDPQGLSSGLSRVMRGCSWDNNADVCNSSNRGYYYSSYTYNTIGFRLASSANAAPIVATSDQTGVVADVATVATGVECHSIAEGGTLEGMAVLGYAPTENRNAIVATCGPDGDVELVNSDAAGTFLWFAPMRGSYTLMHEVGDDLLEATYSVAMSERTEPESESPLDEVETVVIEDSQLSFDVAAKGATKLVRIKGTGNWTAETSSDWLTLSKTSGTAPMNIAFTAAENAAAESRVGYVYVAGYALKVMQTGRNVTLDKTSVAVDCAGGEASVAISATDATTTWNAWSDVPWISVWTQKGTGSDEIVFQIAPWNSATPRTGTVTIAGQAVTVTQSGAQFACPSETAKTVASAGATGTLAISASQGVSWCATSDADWLVVDDDSILKRGDATLVWDVGPQPTLSPRTATITITPSVESGFGPWTFVVTQKAAEFTCPTATTKTVDASGATDSFSITTEDGVAWTATSSASWLVVENDGTMRTGSGVVEWTAQAQTTLNARTATITVKTLAASGNKTWTFTVTQEAATATLSEKSRSVSAQGEEIEAAVIVADGVGWSIGDWPNWITLDGDVERSGSGTAKLVVAPNQTFEERSGTVMIAGLEFTVAQDVAKIEIVDGLNRHCSEEGAYLVITACVDVADTPWTIEIPESANEWLILFGSEERMGDDTFDLFIDSMASTGESVRAANITIGNQVLRIVQGDDVAVDPVPEVAADASQEIVAAALDGAADARLAENLTTAAKYTAYRAWVDGVAGTDLSDAAVVAKRQAIKDATHAWLAYALDLCYDSTVALAPKQGDLVVATFVNGVVAGGTATLPSGGAATSAGDAWTLTVALDGVSVGANATAANLAEAFQIEGAMSLDDAAFSSSSVTATFSPTSDGKVSIMIRPADATAQTFFVRVKLMP